MHRERKRTRSYSGYVALLCDIIDKEPSSYEEATGNKEWKDVIIKEYQSIMKNDVWDVVPRLEGNSIVTSRWIYKIKHAVDGSIDKYKARFVARGFSQKEGIDYEETFAPVARYTSSQIHFHHISTSSSCSDEMEDTPDGYQDILLEW